MGARGIMQAGEERAARVESLRALAALAVLEVHVWVASHTIGAPLSTADRLAVGGVFGVNLFFVLTGYLLYLPFAPQRGRVDLARYARNRALRILPLYYVVLATLLVFKHGGGTIGQWARFATFTQNFSTATVNTVDPPMWSLAVEIEFYVLLPLIAAAIAWVARGSRGRAVLVIAAAGVASVVVRQITVWHSVDPGGRWSKAFPGLFFLFAMGMLLALVKDRWDERPPRLPGILTRSDVWIGAAAALWSYACFDHSRELATGFASMLLVGAAVLPLRDGLFLRLLDVRALAAVGVASYSLYLWHYPLIAELGRHAYLPLLAASAVAAVAVALLSYRVVEAPFLRLRRRWRLADATASADAWAPPSSSTPAPPLVPSSAASSAGRGS
jgi:peptidoglycan/LPS O-acetylase OafA/YrhL